MEPRSRSRRWLPVKPLEQDRKLLALTQTNAGHAA